jgi:uncharacterized metal-binding protein
MQGTTFAAASGLMPAHKLIPKKYFANFPPLLLKEDTSNITWGKSSDSAGRLPAPVCGETTMEDKQTSGCAGCRLLGCRTNDASSFPPFCPTKNIDARLLRQAMDIYASNEEFLRLARASTILEGETYGRLTRVEETIEFIRRMNFRAVGVASCVGLMAETSVFVRILKREGIESFTVGCKAGAEDKTAIGVPESKKINGGCGHESMCNPIMQAKVLAARKTDFNIVIGLCVGHDSLFIANSQAPVTVMIVKDRVLGHNPAVALYTADGMYSRFKKQAQSTTTS